MGASRPPMTGFISSVWRWRRGTSWTASATDSCQERHFEIVFSLNFQRPRPNIMFGNEQQISSVGEQVVVALHTWIRFEAVLQPQREIPEFLQRIHIPVGASRVEDHSIVDLEG